MSKFYCATHNKYKAIPRQSYQDGDRVNYILKGHGGHPATNAKGSVQLIQGNLLHIATDHGKNIKLINELESVTPYWAPSPLQYATGKCWCAIEAEPVQQDGAA